MGHVHNSLDRAVDLIRGYRRAMGLLGPEGGVERFGETVTPTMNIWGESEWNCLRGDWLQWAQITVAAGGAGLRSMVRLRPVSTSRMVVIVHEIESSTACLIQNALAADLPTVNSIGQRDTRNPADARVRFTSDNTAALSGSSRYSLVNVPFRTHFPILCHTDGDGTNSGAVTVVSNADNTAITVSMAWTVHDLMPGESRTA